MSYSVTVTTLGNLASNISTILSGASGNVIGIKTVANRTGFVRVYDETLGGTVSANATNLPTISSASQIVSHTQFDDAAPWYSQGGDFNSGTVDGPGSARQGMIEVRPVVPAADSVNAASVQTFKADPSTVVIYATN